MAPPVPHSSSQLSSQGQSSVNNSAPLSTVASISSSPWKSSITLLSDVIAPQIQLVDEQVKLTKNSQLSLAKEIELMNETLLAVVETSRNQPHLDAYLEKLSQAQKKLHSVCVSVEASQERLLKLGKMIDKESAKQRSQMVNTTNSIPSALS